MTIPVILDCDPGHDDALAILLAAVDPAIDLLAVTVVAGNQTLERTTVNARRVCALVGADVPVAAGAAGPLLRPLHTAEYIHGETGLDGPRRWPGQAELRPEHAVQLMRRILGGHERHVTLVATGPLTNVALLIRDQPDALAGVREIVLMGGSTGRGNFSPYAEFNIAVDPEAADIVFSSGLPVTMIGLNVTHQVLVTSEVVDRLRSIGTVVSELCLELMTFYGDAYRDVFGFDSPPLHDPLAVAAVIDPEIVGVRAAPVRVELRGEHTVGATVVDLDHRTGAPDNAQVGISVDVPRFWDRMLAAIAAAPASVSRG